MNVNQIDALLPQTQCRECGFAGCLPYAKALVNNTAPINRCPPGGEKTVEALAKVLKLDPKPYLTEYKTRQPAMAFIRENECIGCTKCIQACPVDAIIGSAKMMHTILTAECTGCGLCIEPCPVDCIELTPIPEPQYDKLLAKQRFEAKQAREQPNFTITDEHSTPANNSPMTLAAKQHYLAQALARVKNKKKPTVSEQ